MSATIVLSASLFVVEAFMVTVKVDTPLLREPSPLSDKEAQITAGARIEVIGPGSSIYVHARKGETEGYLAIAAIDKAETGTRNRIEALIREAAATERESKLESDKKEAETRWENRIKREQALAKEYGAVDGKRIADGEAWIGMTAKQAMESWGEPETVNRTEVAARTVEQWVYARGKYLYVEKGLVTGIQK